MRLHSASVCRQWGLRGERSSWRPTKVRLVSNCISLSDTISTYILCECIWVQGPTHLSYLSFPTSIFCTYSSDSWPASLSPPWGPADSCLFTCRLLTSTPAPLARFKSFKNTSVTLTYSPPEQARRLSVDLSGGHKSGQLQRGKIRELSLAGICARWISKRWVGDCSMCDLWLAVCEVLGLCMCIFNFHSSTECQHKALALFQGLFCSFLHIHTVIQSRCVQFLWRLFFKTKYISTCW